MDVRISTDPTTAAAAHIVDCLARAVAERDAGALAVSGGSTAPPMFDAMAAASANATDTSPGPVVTWGDVGIWQVDERIAPDGDADRNATQLTALAGVVHEMPVTAPDRHAAMREYARTLPERFDVVHLGVGPDGHTASWAPAPHPDAERALTSHEPVFAIGEFNGRERMTLGVPVVNAAAERVVLVTGASKAEVVGRWVHGTVERNGAWIDPTLPIAAVEPSSTTVYLDHAAAGALTPADYVDLDRRGDPSHPDPDVGYRR